jgi:hypothetical protein
MSLQGWAESGWLRPHQTSLHEVRGLLAIVDRDLKDSAAPISPDWRFGIAYNAALRLCTILLYASGYRAEKSLQHYRTIQSLPVILGSARQPDAEYLDACRRKRNIAEYDAVGCATARDAEELAAFAKRLRSDVLDWLRKHHPEFLGG